MGCSLVVLELTHMVLGCVVQSVACLTADPGIASSILAQSQPSHTFMKIDHEIIATVIFLMLIQEGSLSVTSESTGSQLGQVCRGKSVIR